MLVRLDGPSEDGRGDTLSVYVELAEGGYLWLDIKDRVTVRLLGVPIGLAERAFWQEWFSTSSSGKAVSVDSAMRRDSIFGASLSAEEAAAKVFAKRTMSLLVV